MDTGKTSRSSHNVGVLATPKASNASFCKPFIQACRLKDHSWRALRNGTVSGGNQLPSLCSRALLDKVFT